MARENLVTGVPPVRIHHRVGVDVPAAVVGVPVRVHGPDASCKIPSIPLSIEYSLDCTLFGVLLLSIPHQLFLFFFLHLPPATLVASANRFI